jgi:hypothetical protein
VRDGEKVLPVDHRESNGHERVIRDDQKHVTGNE